MSTQNPIERVQVNVRLQHRLIANADRCLDCIVPADLRSQILFYQSVFHNVVNTCVHNNTYDPYSFILRQPFAVCSLVYPVSLQMYHTPCSTAIQLVIA